MLASLVLVLGALLFRRRGLHFHPESALLLHKLGAAAGGASHMFYICLGHKAMLLGRALAALVVQASLLRQLQPVEEQRLRLYRLHQIKEIRADPPQRHPHRPAADPS
jgi:hypothetical protein